MTKTPKYLAFHVTTLAIGIIFILFLVRQGKGLELNTTPPVQVPADQTAAAMQAPGSHAPGPLAILLLQILIILVLARMIGQACRKIGQPAVVGEIIAGIALGPSLLGHYFPAVSDFVFPAYSLNSLQLLSQIGLILFMFMIGLEMDLQQIRQSAREALVISNASIIFPFLLGFMAAYFLYAEFAPAGIGFLPFGLFLAISLSITAFPVLARIVKEKQLTGTPIGYMVITCAAVNDLAAWCLLAFVITMVNASSYSGSLTTVFLSMAFVVLMITMVKPALQAIAARQAKNGKLPPVAFAQFFVLLVAASLTAEWIGIHALFGAFMTGLVIPAEWKLREALYEKVADIALFLLLPLFFVFTGLRTSIGLINSTHLWLVCTGVILLAVSGKFLGSMAAARYASLPWKTSLQIGALMNTRGLVELVVLNIGYDLGVLSPQIFTILVIMALVTTLMAGPLLNWIERIYS
jgi:Kef-type K+ transport system membrane component KefB